MYDTSAVCPSVIAEGYTDDFPKQTNKSHEKRLEWNMLRCSWQAGDRMVVEERIHNTLDSCLTLSKTKFRRGKIIHLKKSFSYTILYCLIFL